MAQSLIGSHLKKVFSAELGVASSTQVLEILMYVCGLILGRALISTENPNFEMASEMSCSSYIGSPISVFLFELLELPPQRRAGYAQKLDGFGFVAAGGLQDLENVLLFHFGQGHKFSVDARLGRIGRMKSSGKMFGFDDVSIGEDDGTFDDVL